MKVPDLWVNADPTLSFEDPTLAALHDYWLGKRRGRIMPSRRDVDPLELRQHLGSLCLIDVEHAPLRMRYRLLGTNIVETMGRDATGCYYDELYPEDLLASVVASFRWMIAHSRPLRTFGQAYYPNKHYYRYETLNLPLSEDGATVNMVLGKLVFRLAAG